MEIAKNTTTLTKKGLHAFQFLEMIKKSWLIAICSIGLIILAFGINNGQVFLRSIPFLVIGCAVYPFYIIILEIIFARQNKNFEPTKLEYTFTDEKIIVFGESAKAKENTELFYTNLVSVRQTRKIIYLYINKSSALVVDKKGFTSGTPEKLLSLIDLRFKEHREKTQK